jgi:hypothetical protein
MTKQEIVDLVKAACFEAGLDPAYGLGVIEHESGFNPSARSDPKASDEKYGGAWGLCQILPPTARGLGYTGPVEGLWDPHVNVDLLLKLTAQNRDHFNVHDAANLASCHNSGLPLARLIAGSSRLHDVEAYVAAVLPLIVRWRAKL